MFGLVEFLVDFILQADGGVRIFGLVFVAVYVQLVAGFFFECLAEFYLVVPQFVNDGREIQHRVDFVFGIGAVELLVPIAHLLDVFGFQFLDDLVIVAAHARVAQQKVVNLTLGGALFAKGHAFGRVFEPLGVFLGCNEGVLVVALAACANQGVSVD